MRFTTSSIMSTNLISINEDDDVGVAARIMKTNRIRHLPVVDSSNNLTGIVSSTDVLRTAGRKVKIKSIMSPKVRIVRQSTPIQKVISHMLEHKMSSVLVAADEEIVGIVTRDDLFQLLYELIDDREHLVSLDIQSMLDQEWDEADRSDWREIETNIESLR